MRRPIWQSGGKNALEPPTHHPVATLTSGSPPLLSCLCPPESKCSCERRVNEDMLDAMINKHFPALEAQDSALDAKRQEINALPTTKQQQGARTAFHLRECEQLLEMLRFVFKVAIACAAARPADERNRTLMDEPPLYHLAVYQRIKLFSDRDFKMFAGLVQDAEVAQSKLRGTPRQREQAEINAAVNDQVQASRFDGLHEHLDRIPAATAAAIQPGLDECQIDRVRRGIDPLDNLDDSQRDRYYANLESSGARPTHSILSFAGVQHGTKRQRTDNESKPGMPSRLLAAAPSPASAMGRLFGSTPPKPSVPPSQPTSSASYGAPPVPSLPLPPQPPPQPSFSTDVALPLPPALPSSSTADAAHRLSASPDSERTAVMCSRYGITITILSRRSRRIPVARAAATPRIRSCSSSETS